jgi:hypothetical protein
MSDNTMAVVSAAAETLEEAHEVAGRLTQAGFARNSIKVVRRAEDLYEVSLHVREANRAKAEQAIENRSGLSLGSFSAPGLGAALGIGAAAVGLGLLAALGARPGLSARRERQGYVGPRGLITRRPRQP